MAWASDLLRSRVSFPIVFAGAALIIGLIRLTSLLPEQYYFRFSTLISSDRSPFIVEPPGVTYARLCQIVTRHHLDQATFSLNLEGCARAAQSSRARPEKNWGEKNESDIYRLVYANDEGIRRTIEDAVRNISLAPLTASDIQADMANAQSLQDAIGVVTQRYHTQLQQRFVDLVAQQPQRFQALRPLFEGLPPNEPQKAEQPYSPKGLDEKGAAAFVRAVTAANASIASPLSDVRLEPISKSKLDDIIRISFAREALSEQLLAYYISQIGDRYVAQLTASLKNEGIDNARDKTTVDKLIRDDATGAYLLSVAVRLAPVLVFGLLVGLVFGAREITSAALAAALAAFLLAWPVVLLWDQVVNYTWQDKRPIFFAFYILYVISFFIAARFAAGIGATMRGWLPLKGQADTAVAEGGVGVGVLRDFTIALIVNALFYVGNALMVMA